MEDYLKNKHLLNCTITEQDVKSTLEFINGLKQRKRIMPTACYNITGIIFFIIAGLSLLFLLSDDSLTRLIGISVTASIGAIGFLFSCFILKASARRTYRKERARILNAKCTTLNQEFAPRRI